MLFALGVTGGLRAQFLGGIFNQGATQLKEYEQQIAAYQIFISKLEKGYQIVETGISDIGSITKGEFTLHQAFFSSLAAINPAIGKMAEVAEILALQASIVEGFTLSLDRWKKGGGLSSGDLGFIGEVYSNICQQGLKDVEELLNLTTASKLTMSDDQRISRIQQLDEQEKNEYVFYQQFSSRTDMLVAQRQGISSDNETLLQYYGLQ